MFLNFRPRTTGIAILLVAAGVLPVLTIGCGEGSGERIVATEPQAENQKARSREQEVAHLTKMLKYDDEGKVRRAIVWLGGDFAADSASAIPTLEDVAANHSNEKIKTAAREAIEKIKGAKKP